MTDLLAETTDLIIIIKLFKFYIWKAWTIGISIS